MTMTVLLALHIVAATVWVGGMFFAYVVLRPAVGGIEPAPERPRLWRRVFDRFFLFVSISVLTLLATGYAMLFVVLGGFANAGIHIHIMNGVGLLMMLMYGHLRFAVWPKFRNAVDAGDFEQAGTRLVLIRKIVHVNLGLGMITMIVAATGRYWP
ncbi:CopD family protein [Thalassobaculum sp. OXR-137]|uniref:CopD family protein n=1 Tax=Thalassobaculum sp. OXR-137 TaxID=3100173 RepID=UPI002AC980D6|nr:CopD family protein [Thalassobaculum sp. OXR-137]WPZ32822.1 CopD family protein [Thalassobaculum sp. OXR-137]